MTTCSNQDMWCCVTLPSNLNCMGVNKSCILVDTFNTIAIKTTLIRTMDTVDISLTISLKGRKIKLIKRHIKAILARIAVKSLSNLSTIPHDLFRYTAHINTGTADLFSFKENNLSAVHSSTISTGNPTRATTDDNIIVFFYHNLPLMFLYGAYELLDKPCKPFLILLYHKLNILTKIRYDTKKQSRTQRDCLIISYFSSGLRRNPKRIPDTTAPIKMKRR